MNARRWTLCATLVCTLALAAGCISDDVVYVDEHGNELAVDESGQPITPGYGMPSEMPPPLVADGTAEGPPQPAQPPADGASFAPDMPAAPAPATVPTPAAAPAPSGAPAPDPNWKMPAPAGPAPGAMPELPPLAPPAAKKLDSSSGLDRPPAG